jgi:peptidoglycan hydrolase-like protein with peptidoglycan-binding domain
MVHNKNMMIKKCVVGVVMVALAAVATPASAQSPDVSELLRTLATLMKQVEELQKQLSVLRGEVREVRQEIRAGLRAGMTDEDIREIQELLATDPEIYPEGLVTGHFGGLTRQALLRFQERHGLRPTGEVDEETRAVLIAYLREGGGPAVTAGGNIPPGLLRAPGIQRKIKERAKSDESIVIDCAKLPIPGPICEARLGMIKRPSAVKPVDTTNITTPKPETVTATSAAQAIDAATTAVKELEAAIVGAIGAAATPNMAARPIVPQAHQELLNATPTEAVREVRRQIPDVATAAAAAVREARRELREARLLVAMARRAYAVGNYERAYDKAFEARDTALDALDDLKDALDPDDDDEGDQ